MRMLVELVCNWFPMQSYRAILALVVVMVLKVLSQFQQASEVPRLFVNTKMSIEVALALVTWPKPMPAKYFVIKTATSFGLVALLNSSVVGSVGDRSTI